MKLKRVSTMAGEHYGWRFHCPGCNEEHVIDRTWQCNGDPERPSISPSIDVQEIRRTDGSVFSPRCHSYVHEGRIEFLSDSGHALSGQTVDLPEL